MIQNILLYNRKTETGLEPVYYQYDDGKTSSVKYGEKKYFCIEFLGYKYDWSNYSSTDKEYDGLFSDKLYRSTIRIPYDKLNSDLKNNVIPYSVYQDMVSNAKGLIYEGVFNFHNIFPITSIIDGHNISPAGVGYCIAKDNGRAGNLAKYETFFRFYTRIITRTSLKVV